METSGPLWKHPYPTDGKRNLPLSHPLCNLLQTSPPSNRISIGRRLLKKIHTDVDEDEREAFHELLSVEGFNCVRTNILADGFRHGSAGLQLAFSRQANRNQNPRRGSTQVRSLLRGQSSAPGFPAFHQYRSR